MVHTCGPRRAGDKPSLHTPTRSMYPTNSSCLSCSYHQPIGIHRSQYSPDALSGGGRDPIEYQGPLLPYCVLSVYTPLQLLVSEDRHSRAERAKIFFCFPDTFVGCPTPLFRGAGHSTGPPPQRCFALAFLRYSFARAPNYSFHILLWNLHI